MAYVYHKKRSPYWYIQYIDSERKKHDKSTGLRADDPNDTIKAKILRAELEAKEYQRLPVINGAAWDSWVPKFFARHCDSPKTLERYEDAWKWIALWLQRLRDQPQHWLQTQGNPDSNLAWIPAKTKSHSQARKAGKTERFRSSCRLPSGLCWSG